MTIDDVAKACGLSRATVSRVLQQSPNVSKKSRILVEKTIKEIGYQPSMIAQSLAQGYSNTIALIVGNISSVAQIETAKKIQSELYNNGYMVWLCNSDYNRDLCGEYIDASISSKVGGIILLTIMASDEKLAQLKESGVPTVLINGQNFNIPFDSILGNDQKSAFQAVKYLAENGHRHIALLCSSLTLLPSLNIYLGYRIGLEASKLAFDESNVYEIDIQKYSDTLKERTTFDAKRLFAEHPEVTAVICANNEIAHEFYRQCCELSISIPDDISLVTMDPSSKNIYPGLAIATFGISKQTLGSIAVKQILYRIHQRKTDKNRTAEFKAQNIVLDSIFFKGNSVKMIGNDDDSIKRSESLRDTSSTQDLF